MAPKINAERVRGLFEYDQLTGVFTSRKTGRPIGRKDRSGYLRWSIYVNGKASTVLLHRMAWLVVTESWPSGQIDHINGDPIDNRFANLRVVTQRQNNENFSRASARSKTGLLGVSDQGRWGFGARICVNGKDTWLGTFDTPEEAHAVYLAKKREVHQSASAAFIPAPIAGLTRVSGLSHLLGAGVR